MHVCTHTHKLEVAFILLRIQLCKLIYLEVKTEVHIYLPNIFKRTSSYEQQYDNMEIINEIRMVNPFEINLI